MNSRARGGFIKSLVGGMAGFGLILMTGACGNENSGSLTSQESTLTGRSQNQGHDCRGGNHQCGQHNQCDKKGGHCAFFMNQCDQGSVQQQGFMDCGLFGKCCLPTKCPEIAPPDASFCTDGKIETQYDSNKCITGYKCIKPTCDCGPKPEVAPCADQTIPAMECVSSAAQQGTKCSWKVAECPKCPQITPPDPSFCTDGKIETQYDANKCITGYKCIKPTCDCGPKPEVAPCADQTIPAMECVMNVIAETTNPAGGCEPTPQCSWKVAECPKCPEIAPPDASFCTDGKIETQYDANKCITGYKCVKPTCDCGPKPEVTPCQDKSIPAMECVMNTTAETTNPAGGCEPTPQCSWKVASCPPVPCQDCDQQR